MTIDGHMVADFMDTGTLTAILLKSSNYATDSQGNLIQGSRFNLANGLLETVNCILNGKITSMDGDIGGRKIGSDGLTSNNALASINIYNQNNKAMKLSYGGLHLFNHYSGASEYLGSMLTTYNQEDQSNGICLTQSGNAEYLGIGYTEATSPSAGDQISFGMVYSHNGGSVQGTPIIAGFNFFKDIDLGYNFITNCGRINGGIPITSENKNDYTYPIAQHYHNIYEINNLNLTLQEFDGRIRALENA
jgi:hypothetical protein